jgi:hypothetical protein
MEYSTSYQLLKKHKNLPNRWFVGHAGTKLYLHDFENYQSWVLMKEIKWSLWAEI